MPPRDISPLVGVRADNSQMGDIRETKPKRIKQTFAVKPDADPPRGSNRARQIWHQCIGCDHWYAAPAKEINRGRWLYCSTACCGRHAATTGKFKGARNPRWLGGVSSDNMRYRNRQKERHPIEEAARKAVYNAKKRGDLVPQPCACGSTKTQAHHTDYSKQLDVVWMCRPCHDAEHAQLKLAKRAA